MKIGSGFDTAAAMAQVTQSAQIMNQLNQRIVDESFDTSKKLLNANWQMKLSAAQSQATAQAVDAFA